MIFGFMSIFGNGVLEGWEITVSLADKLTITIASGRGHINFFSAFSEFPTDIELEPNQLYYIYAARNSFTATNEDVSFIASLFLLDNDYLLLGTVLTNDVTIETIDVSDRQEIELLEQIKELIRQHKHRGGTNHPSKIDLQTDVKNQLPPFRISDIDAAKITTGTVDLVRLPLLSHNLLQNIGQLTHAQIESFIKTLEVSNKELFGEIATVNMLQQHILMKYLHDDPDSPFFTSDITDKDYKNEFTIIPGISPEKFLDRENTTAIIDTELREIRGVPPVQGSTFNVVYDSDLAWNTAFLMEKVTAVNDKVILIKQDDETTQTVIENFESATGDDQVISDGSIFTKEIVQLNPDDAQIVSESSVVDVSEGAFSAKVTNAQAFRK